MFDNVWPRLKKDGQPSFYSNWCQLMMSLTKPPYEVAIVGSDYKKAHDAFLRMYQPDAVFLGGSEEGRLPLLQYKLVEGETLIYVCRNHTCKRPTDQMEEALELMKE